MIRWKLHILVVLLVTALAAAGLGERSHGQVVDPERVAIIKAGFIVNFLKFTEWPKDVFGAPDSPVILTIVGRDCLQDVIERAVAGHQVGGRSIQVRRLIYPVRIPSDPTTDANQMQRFVSELRSSHAVFICDSEQARVSEYLRYLERVDALTISEVRDFAAAGGMLGFVVSGGRVTFEANPDEIRETRVRVSSKVLGLARIVRTRR